jgi:hypothetical protein
MEMAITWPYLIEDDFLAEEDFDYLNLLYDHVVKDKGILLSKNKIWMDGRVEGALPDIFLKNFAKSYTKKLFTQLENLAPERLSLVTWLELNLVWTDKDAVFDKHVDSPNKLLSVVVYLCPEKNRGTILYSDEKGSDKTQMEWVQNRAFSFAREQGVTWHSYEGDGKAVRFCLVLNLRC